jgi:16S rRNA (cytidine1402-2'-O)-methyltransferase
VTGRAAAGAPAAHDPVAAAPAGEDAEPPAPVGGGTLYVVATPIGNLADVTLRALDVLRAVPLVAAEDTRLTRRLFARHGIPPRLVSHHARNAATRVPELLAHLRGGADLALVTDAGTPLVSDPGGSLVAAWAADGGRVVPVPGPSAALAALVASGVAGPRWVFEGFVPRSGRERRERLAAIAGDERAAILFEAPGRLAATLADLAAACGPERPAAVCRELTKLHEEVRRGPLASLAAAAAAGDITARGEIAIVVGAAAPGRRVPIVRPAAAAGAADERLAAARAEVERLVAEGMARGAAARRVAAAAGLPRRALYGAPAER